MKEVKNVPEHVADGIPGKGGLAKLPLWAGQEQMLWHTSKNKILAFARLRDVF